MQWGYVSTSGINSQLTFSYPLTTTTIYCILVTHQRYDKSNHEANAYCISKNANSALIMAQRDYTFILIIAEQQWGEGSYSTYTFPIAFTNTSYVFVSQMNLNFADAHYERNNYVNQKQITYITLGSASLNRFWTAIGY